LAGASGDIPGIHFLSNLIAKNGTSGYGDLSLTEARLSAPTKATVALRGEPKRKGSIGGRCNPHKGLVCVR
jgi:hypothetical protein